MKSSGLLLISVVIQLGAMLRRTWLRRRWRSSRGPGNNFPGSSTGSSFPARSSKKITSHSAESEIGPDQRSVEFRRVLPSRSTLARRPSKSM